MFGNLKRQRIDVVFLLILAVAAFLLFFRLDHRPLWQDEGETACLARNVLKYGVPKAFDGTNLVSQEEGREFGGDYLWRWSPWLQIYTVALGLKLWGFTTTACRLPSAILGLACVACVYFMVRHLFKATGWARLSALLLALNVPFLLFARQGRYYAMGCLLTVSAIWAFRSNWRERWAPGLVLVASMVLLFHANYLLCFGFGIGLVIGGAAAYGRVIFCRRAFVLAGLTLLLVFPGVFLYGIGTRSSLFDLTVIPHQAERYGFELVCFLLPLPIALILLWRWRRAVLLGGQPPQEPMERFATFLCAVMLMNIAALFFVPQAFFRYIVHLLPLACVVLAWCVVRLYRVSRIASIGLAVLLAFTNWVHTLPLGSLGLTRHHWSADGTMLTYPNMPLGNYLREVMSDYPDVNGAAVKFLSEHAAPDDTVLASYGDMSLQFYLHCRVVGGLAPVWIDLEEPPDWIVTRQIIRVSRESVYFPWQEYLEDKVDLERDYEPIALDSPDELFGNRPDPYTHRFVPVIKPYMPLVIHKRRQGDGG